MSGEESAPAGDFIRDLVRSDNEEGTFGGRVQTRFTHDPEDARRHFLQNRDPRLWRIVVTPLTRHGKAVAPPGAATDQSVPVPATAG